MKKKVIIFLQDIFESIEKIEKYTEEVSKEEFFREDQIQDAVLIRLAIIGEAVKNLPVNFRKKYPDVSWKQIAGMRDIIIHEYFGVKLERVWKTVKEDLPELKEKISNILKEI